MHEGQTFISYSRTNSNFVLRLAKDLKAAGYNVWLDQLDIPPGVRWDDELEKALQMCDIFMVILTPASISSDNVKDEIGYAIDARKRILPVLLENATLPLRLRRFQYVDFTAKSYEEGINGAKQLLNNLIESPTHPGTEVPPDSQAQNPDIARKAPKEVDLFIARPAKVETDRKTEEEKPAAAKPLSTEKKAESVLGMPVPRKSISKSGMIGMIAAGILVIAAIGAGFRILTNSKTPAAVHAPVSTPTAPKTPATVHAPAPTPTASRIVLLSQAEAKKVVESEGSKDIFIIALEQHTYDEFTKLFNNHLPIPVTLDNSVPIPIGGLGSCATNQEILMDNFKYIQLLLVIDGELIPENKIANVNEVEQRDGTSMECIYKYAVISKWASGKYSVAEELKLIKKINNGLEDMEAHSFKRSYTVTVP